MKNKIIVTTAALALMVTGLYASKDLKYEGCHKMMNTHGKHQGKGGHMMVGMFMQLDLSDKQRTEIKQILQDSRKNIQHPSDAFTDSTFDKKKFIKLVNERKAGKIERKAEVIEKMYNILNSAQKKELRTMIDTRKEKHMNRRNKMLEGGGSCPKHCKIKG